MKNQSGDELNVFSRQFIECYERRKRYIYFGN